MNLVVKDSQQRLILEEISRLSKSITKGDAPAGGAEITAIIIDMLTHILLGKMSTEEFIKTMTTHPVLESVHNYYIEFFSVITII